MKISEVTKRAYIGGTKFQKNDTLLARITPSLENGKTGFVDFLDESEIASGSTEFIVLRAKENISPYWVYCLAREDNFRYYAISSMVGSSGRQRVQDKYLEQYAVRDISIEEMFSFEDTVKPIFETILCVSKQNDRLFKLKPLLLARMVK